MATTMPTTMPSRFRVVALLFAHTIGRIVGRPRNLLFFALFYGFPALVGWLLNRLAPPIERVAAVSLFYGVVYPTLYLALPALLYGSSALAQELEERTVTFLLLRPIPKWTVVLGKYLGVVVLLGALTSASFGAFYAVCDLRGASARDLGGTEALLAVRDADRDAQDRARRALSRKRDATERAHDEHHAEVDAWKEAHPGGAVPQELTQRHERIEADRNAHREESRRLRREVRGQSALYRRWEEGRSRPDRALALLGYLWLGVAAYTALFVFLATAFRHYFITGIIYAVLYQTVVMPLFQQSRIKWTVLNYHVQTLVHNEVLAAPGGLGQVYLGHDSGDALVLLVAAAAGLLVAACVVFTRKEYVLSQ